MSSKATYPVVEKLFGGSESSLDQDGERSETNSENGVGKISEEEVNLELEETEENGEQGMVEEKEEGEDNKERFR